MTPDFLAPDATLGITRVSDCVEAGSDRRWVGNDSSQRNRNGVIHLAESPLTLALAWREYREAAEHAIGTFRLDLHRLLEARVIRLENEASVRVRIIHQHSGEIVLQTRLSAPGVLLGRL